MIPGGLLHPFVLAIEEDPEIELIMPKHEEGGAFMADGFARTSGRMAVCAGTSGPGATNMLTGVACAFADGVPMLVITGQAASHALGKGAAQETAREDIDIVEMFRPVTKYSAMVTSADTMPHHLRRALRLAMTGRPGPVHLNVPVEIWEKPVAEKVWLEPKQYRAQTRSFDRAAVQQAAEVLLNAERPVLLAGSGVGIGGATEHLRALAELLPARVATTPRGKGLLREDHPLSLGVLGVAGHREARETIIDNDLDVLFSIGASLGETSTLNWSPALRPKKSFIQLDVDPDRIGRNYPVDIGLLGDCQSILIELIYHLHRRIREGALPKSTWNSAPPLTRGHQRYDRPAERTSDAVPLTPQRWRTELETLLPHDAIIFSDIGGHMLFNLHDLCIRAKQKFVINMGFGSMGHGTVAPIGAALANPGRTIVSIVGDGCFTMNGLELITAAEFDIPVVWIVENNQGHNITWHCTQILSPGKKLSVARYRKPLSIAKLAQGMGLHGVAVDNARDFRKAFASALASERPCVIEVITDAEIPPPFGARAKSLAGFIE